MKLELYYPVRPFHITQHFAENSACVKNFGTPSQQIIGVQNNATCPVGYDKLYDHFGMAGHNGLDLKAGVQNVYAACAGTVIEQQLVPARGLGLGIITDTPVEVGLPVPYYMKMRYWHLKEFKVRIGDTVQAGDLIGISDTTGYSAGNHVHFEGQPMQKDEGGHPKVLFGNGNYFGMKFIGGGIDIEPYFNGQYADALTLTKEQVAIKSMLENDPQISRFKALIQLILTFIR